MEPIHLKPATNCSCTPYKFGKQLGLRALWPCTTALDAAGALTGVSNKLPFLRVALSWKPSLFPLGDLDIGHNIVTPWTVAHQALLSGILQARIPEWVVIFFFRGSFQPSDWTQVYCIAGRFFEILLQFPIAALVLYSLKAIYSQVKRALPAT